MDLFRNPSTRSAQWKQLAQQQMIWCFLSVRRGSVWRLEEWSWEALLHQKQRGRLYTLWGRCKQSWRLSSITWSPAEHQTESSCWRLSQQIRKQGQRKHIEVVYESVPAHAHIRLKIVLFVDNKLLRLPDGENLSQKSQICFGLQWTVCTCSGSIRESEFSLHRGNVMFISGGLTSLKPRPKWWSRHPWNRIAVFHLPVSWNQVWWLKITQDHSMPFFFIRSWSKPVVLENCFTAVHLIQLLKLMVSDSQRLNRSRIKIEFLFSLDVN